eukprot:PRCOL_00002082-RA
MAGGDGDAAQKAGFFSMFGGGKTVVKAKLGGSNSMVYDEKRKMWVEKGAKGGGGDAGPSDDDALPPPPVLKRTSSAPSTSPTSQGGDHSWGEAAGSANGNGNGSASAGPPSMTSSASSGNMYRAAGGAGRRPRYAASPFAPKAAGATNATGGPNALLPGSAFAVGGGAKPGVAPPTFFVPGPAAAAEADAGAGPAPTPVPAPAAWASTGTADGDQPYSNGNGSLARASAGGEQPMEPTAAPETASAVDEQPAQFEPIVAPETPMQQPVGGLTASTISDYDLAQIQQVANLVADTTPNKAARARSAQTHASQEADNEVEGAQEDGQAAEPFEGVADGASVAESTGAASQLAQGWAEYYTEEGHLYYYNEQTGESSWYPPEGFQSQQTQHVDGGEETVQAGHDLEQQATAQVHADSTARAPEEDGAAHVQGAVAGQPRARPLTVDLSEQGMGHMEQQPGPHDAHGHFPQVAFTSHHSRVDSKTEMAMDFFESLSPNSQARHASRGYVGEVGAVAAVGALDAPQATVGQAAEETVDPAAAPAVPAVTADAPAAMVAPAEHQEAGQADVVAETPPEDGGPVAEMSVGDAINAQISGAVGSALDPHGVESGARRRLELEQPLPAPAPAVATATTAHGAVDEHESLAGAETRAREAEARAAALEAQVAALKLECDTHIKLCAAAARERDDALAECASAAAAAAEAARAETRADADEEMEDLVVCLGQEEEKVSRLSAKLAELGVDAYELIADLDVITPSDAGDGADEGVDGSADVHPGTAEDAAGVASPLTQAMSMADEIPEPPAALPLPNMPPGMVGP